VDGGEKKAASGKISIKKAGVSITSVLLTPAGYIDPKIV